MNKSLLLISLFLSILLPLSWAFPYSLVSYETSQPSTLLSQNATQIGNFLVARENGTYVIISKLPNISLSRGYIIEFKDDPLIVYENKLKKSVEEKKEKLERASPLYKYTIGAIQSFLISQEEKAIPRKVAEHKQKILQTHALLRQQLGRISPITGRAVSGSSPTTSDFYLTFNGMFLNVSEDVAKEIEKLDYVKAVYPNNRVETLLHDSLPLIGATQVWDLTDLYGRHITGKNITIAIIDTGVDYTHPDLGNCTTAQFLNGQCEKVIGGYDFVNNDPDPIDDHGHGTHCAGIAAGKGDYNHNNIYEPELGEVWGVAPDAKIVAYKVLNKYGYGYWDDVIAAIERAVDPDQDGDTSDHVDVISMSLGGRGNPDDPVSQAVDNAVDAGVVVVVAAGNWGPDEQTIASPGCARKAITVGATYKKNYYLKNKPYLGDPPLQNKVAWFSSRGPVNVSSGVFLVKPEIVAPGAFICSARYDEVYKDFSEDECNFFDLCSCIDKKHLQMPGTSMATPMVAGAAALLLQLNKSFSPLNVKNILLKFTDDLNLSIFTQGYGKLNIYKAVTHIFKNTPFLWITSIEIFDKNNNIPEMDEEITVKVKLRNDKIKLSHVKIRLFTLDKCTNVMPKIITLGDIDSYSEKSVNFIIKSMCGARISYILLSVNSSEYNRSFILSFYIYPKIVFNQTIGESLKVTPMINDIDQDAKKEIIVFNKTTLFIFNSSGNIGIVKNIISDGSIINSPSIGNLIGDSRKEIVAVKYDGSLFVINSNGIIINKFSDLKYAGFPVLEDVDKDNYDEIIITGYKGGSDKICVIDINDNKKDCWPVDTVRGSYLVYDLNQDNEKEVIFCGNRILKAFDIHGNMIWSRRFRGYCQESSLAAFTFNNEIFILLASSSYLDLSSFVPTKANFTIYLFNSSGDLKWKKEIFGDIWSMSNPVIFQTNNEVREIATSLFGVISVLESDGSIVDGWSIKINNPIRRSPVVYKNQNKENVILVLGKGTKLLLGIPLEIYIFDDKGNLLGYINGFTPDDASHNSLYIEDIDSDGRIDLLLQTYNKIYLFNLGDYFQGIEWKTARADDKNRAIYSPKINKKQCSLPSSPSCSIGTCTCSVETCSRGWLRIKLPSGREIAHYFENGEVTFLTDNVKGDGSGFISCLDDGKEYEVEISID